MAKKRKKPKDRKKPVKRPRILRPTFKVYQVEGRRWDWSLESSNGKLYALSGVSYKNKRDCIKAIKGLQNMASRCKIEAE